MNQKEKYFGKETKNLKWHVHAAMIKREAEANTDSVLCTQWTSQRGEVAGSISDIQWETLTQKKWTSLLLADLSLQEHRAVFDASLQC